MCTLIFDIKFLYLYHTLDVNLWRRG